jgi:hypothetical protein
MAKGKVSPNPTGRPVTPINWNRVDKLLQAGCKGTEIADAIGISNDTLYDRCLKEKGLSYTDYSVKMRSKGENLIREAQFDKALEGDNTMLIWLGKNRLSQSDKAEVKTEGSLTITLNLEGNGNQLRSTVFDQLPEADS